MCDFCGKKWQPLESEYPCGPCIDKWKCPDCGKKVSPCCGAKIINKDCFAPQDSSEIFRKYNYDLDYCEVCAFCGDEKCSKCGEHCHCGGCV